MRFGVLVSFSSISGAPSLSRSVDGYRVTPNGRNGPAETVADHGVVIERLPSFDCP